MRVNKDPGYEPQMSGFELSHQDKQKAIVKKFPKDKAKFVKAYGVLARKKRGYLVNHEKPPQSLLDELLVWDAHIYKNFPPQERKLIQQAAIMGA